MKQNTKPLNEEVFGVAPMQQKNNSVAETKESETQTPGGVNKLHNRVTQTRVEERLWEKEFDKEICKEYLEYGYKAYVSLVKDFITKALSQRDKEWVEVVKKHRGIFIKNDIVSLVKWNMTEDEILITREVLRIEILEEMGIDCSKMRKKLKVVNQK